MTDIVYVCFEDNGGMLHYAANLAEAAGTISPVGIAVFSEKIVERTYHSFVNVKYIRMKGFCKEGLIGRLQKYNILYYKKKAKELIEATQPKLVHITSYSVCLYSFVRTLTRLKIKTVCTVHDPEVHDEKRTLLGKIVNIYQQKLQFLKVFQCIDAIHVHSIKHLDVLLGNFGSWIGNKTYVVQHGGGIPRTIKEGKEIPPELNRLNYKNYCILFFGRIQPYKGLNVLEKAIHIVRKRGYKITLILAGQGDLGTFLIDAIEDNIIINRFIADKEVARLFEASNVVVLPYLSATQSGVIPLAYAYGKPVICTKVGALDELVSDGETGLVVNPNDHEALANAIIILSDKNTRQKMGNAARKYLESYISWQHIAAKHVDNYKKLALL